MRRSWRERLYLLWVGVDASVKRDSTAIVACTWDQERSKVRLVLHRVFQPTVKEPLDFEATVEHTLLDLHERFNVQEVRFDPYQLVSVAQGLTGQGLPMVEFPQTVGNLTEASSNLYELIKGSNLMVYSDDRLRKSIMQAVAVETPRGWRIAKEKASHRIDVVVALAQAALGAVKGQTIAGQSVEGAGLSSTPTKLVLDRDEKPVKGDDRWAHPSELIARDRLDYARPDPAPSIRDEWNYLGRGGGGKYRW